jgi:O-antigen ligase
VALSSELSLVESFATRLSIASENNSSTSIINPIVVSLFGVCSIIFGVCKLLLFKNNLKKFVFFSIMIILGFLNLLTGASRGPFLILLVLFVFILFRFFKIQQKTGLRYIFNAIIAFLAIFSFSSFVLPYFYNIEFFLLDRIQSSLYSDLEVRNFVVESAFNDFLNNPFFGFSIFDSVYNSFPHNIIIDALMSLGIIGGILVVFSLKPFFVNLHKVIFNKIHIEYCLLFFFMAPIVLIGFTSGSFVFMPEFWIVLSLLSINFKLYKQ